MDPAKPGVLATVMFGSTAGAAAINASTLAVSAGLPPYAEEKFFGSDLSRLPDGQHALV